MSNTEQQWTQDLPQTDGVIFVGAPEFLSPTVALSTLSVATFGVPFYTVPASATSNFLTVLDQILRTGVYAAGPLSSVPGGAQAFGTTGPPPVPGPSTVAGTSGPRGIKVVPPIPKASLPTLASGQFSGPIPKGIQINSVDLIYTVLGVAATSVSFGLASTKFGAAGAGATAPTVTNLIAFGTNSLPTAVAANPVTTNIAVASPAMIVGSPVGLVAQVQFVTPSGSTVDFIGMNVHVSFNYN